MYDNQKIQRFSLTENIASHFNPQEDFDIIDSYKEKIAPYIFTEIKMTDDTEGIQKAFQSRVQILLSSVLLRSLRLHDGIVTALNQNNFPSYYSCLKSFLEVPALLGYIVDYIYNKKFSEEELLPIISKLFLGLKMDKAVKVGVVLPQSDIEQVNILSMLKQTGLVLKMINIQDSSLSSDERDSVTKAENIPTAFYNDVCNFAHIDYPAHLCVGSLDREGKIWRAKQDNINYKAELYDFYMPHFTTAIALTTLMCSLLIKHTKISYFNLLKNPYLFEEAKATN